MVWLSAASLASLSVASALLLNSVSSLSWTAAATIVGIALLFPAVCRMFGLFHWSQPKLYDLSGASSERRLVTQGDALAKALGIPADAVARPRRMRWAAIDFLPLAATALWWAALQFWGTATVRVVVGGSAPAHLLADSEVTVRLLPTNFEAPTAGRFVRILAGKRDLQLVSSGGKALFEAVVTLQPSGTYLLLVRQQSLCPFVDVLRVTPQGPSLERAPLPGTGPLFRLDSPVDAWFLELRGELQPARQGAWQGRSGGSGVRSSLRLLPCEDDG